MLCLAAKGIENLHRPADLVDRRQLQNFGHFGLVPGLFDGGDPLVGVFVQQRLQRPPGQATILVEDGALGRAFGALAARQRRTVEGDGADQVEGVQVGGGLSLQLLPQKALLDQLLQNGLFALGRAPTLEKVVQR